jgi:hypothetical protein
MSFGEELLREIVDGLYRRPAYDNVDALRFPGARPPAWKRALYEFAADRGFVRAEPLSGQKQALAAVSDLEGLEETWSGLQDAYSRRILALVKAYQILGGRRIRFPVSDRWAAAAQNASLARRQENTHEAPILGHLDLFQLDFAGNKISLHVHALNIINTFLLAQYRYAYPPGIAAQPGDVVIDAGSCWGDTALYFAALAGDSGRVLAAECIPANLAILKENGELNPKLGASR